MKPLSRSFLFIGLTTSVALGLISTVAFGQDAAPEATQGAEATAQMPAEPAVAEPAPRPVSENFVSDGSTIGLENLGINITPPQGWEVMTNTGQLSVVMRKPKPEKKVYDKVTYRPNITVAATHKATPIDEKRAAELKEEMTKAFSEDELVSDYQVIEHKFFNYKGENDGLLLYSSLLIKDVPMMQMHILVSGDNKQFLLTYTDLASIFQNTQNPDFQSAWATMTSIEVNGLAPDRMEELMRYGAMAGGVLLLILIVSFVRFRANRRDFLSEADALDADWDGDYATTGVEATLHGGWNLAPKTRRAEPLVEDQYDDDFVNQAPRTKQTTFIASNY